MTEGEQADVLIIGGGIVGCACAYELTKRGATVTLLEYGKAGMQATNAAAGMLAPLSDASGPDAMFRAGLEALRAYPALVAELEQECGFDLEYRQEGILRVAFEDTDAAELRHRFAWQREMGFDVRWLGGNACREIEPRITSRSINGVLSPSEATVSNQLVALALERASRKRGVAVREHSPVTRVRRSQERVVALDAGGETYRAEAIVLAAGARSGQVARKMGIALPVFPIRGQMIALGGMACPIGRPVWGPEGYLVPRVNGLVFAGATVEDVGFRRRTTKGGARAMRAMAARLVPQLSAAKVHFEWAGLRPATADGQPIIGPVPGSNVIAATGHYRNGILLGPLTGSWVAAGIVKGTWDGVPPEFRYERLSG
ncbi:MAG: glycine oxidase ThiO [Dehalococcoidia bacterium]